MKSAQPSVQSTSPDHRIICRPLTMALRAATVHWQTTLQGTHYTPRGFEPRTSRSQVERPTTGLRPPYYKVLMLHLSYSGCMS